MVGVHDLQLFVLAEHGIRFFETSAKNGINVEEAFSTIARDIKRRLDPATMSASTTTPGTIQLGEAGARPRPRSCC